ncbi:MAG: HutD family protein [Symbiobacteriaceae bacterium]|nr:HutD family protein [Symbiobacteriaceae bacterium]
MHYYKIIKADQQRETQWSGGVTRELAIYPSGSSYTNRDFQVRLSTAKINLESSEFTSLPGYTRLIMPLNSNVRLKHEGGSEIELAALKSHTFDGGVQTTSYGKCTDLNLMLYTGWEGSMLAMPPGAAGLFHPGHLMWIYCLHPLTLDCPELFPEGRVSLSAGDLFQMKEYQQSLSILIEADWNARTQVAVFANAWQKR